MIESGSRSPDASSPAKLCDISTQWSLIFAAHRDHGNAAVAAQQILMERYFGAAYRYLLAIVREADSADDLAQEFALRFLRSGFQRLDPQRGRFRDYVKASLQNLLSEYFQNRKRKSTVQVNDSFPDQREDRADWDTKFQERWRDELLEWAWHELSVQETDNGTPYYTVLRWKAENPATSAQMLADKLSSTSGQHYTESGVRQIVHRARERFADLLLSEVERSLDKRAETDLESEMAELELLSYCKSALARRRLSSPAVRRAEDQELPSRTTGR